MSETIQKAEEFLEMMRPHLFATEITFVAGIIRNLKEAEKNGCTEHPFRND